MKNWIVSEINKDEAKRIQTEYGLPPILAMLLQIRGITKREEIENFLQNDSVIASPFEIKDMKKVLTEFYLQLTMMSLYAFTEITMLTASLLRHFCTLILKRSVQTLCTIFRQEKQKVTE